MSRLAELEPCKSLSAFIHSLREGERAIKDQQQLEAEYEEYVKDWKFRSSAAYFALHRQEEWFRSRYHAEYIVDGKRLHDNTVHNNLESFKSVLLQGISENNPESLLRFLPEVREVKNENYRHEYGAALREQTPFADECLLVLRDVPLWVSPDDVLKAFQKKLPQTKITDEQNDTTMESAENGTVHANEGSETPLSVFHTDPLRKGPNADSYSIWVKFPSAEAKKIVYDALDSGEIEVTNSSDIVKDVNRLQGVKKCRIREIVDAAQVEVAKDNDMSRVRTTLEEEHEYILEELVNLSLATSKKKQEKFRNKLEDLAKGLDRQLKRFVKLVHKRVNEMKKHDHIIKFSPETTVYDDNSEHARNLTIPPSRPLIGSIRLPVIYPEPIERRPLPDICSQSDKVADHLNKALVLARALDIETGLSTLPSFLSDESTLTSSCEDSARNKELEKIATKTKAKLSVVHILATNYWLENHETKVDEFLTEIKKKSGYFENTTGKGVLTSIQILDLVVLYLQRVHFYDFYRGIQCSGMGDYLGTIGDTRIRRIVMTNENEHSNGGKRDSDATMATGGVGHKEAPQDEIQNDTSQTNEAIVEEGAVEEAHGGDGQDKEDADEQMASQSSDNNRTPKTRNDSTTTSSDASSRACGAISEIRPKNWRPSYRGKPPSLTLLQNIELKYHLRLRTCRRRIALGLSEGVEQLINVEEESLETGKKLEESSEQYPSFFAILEFPGLEQFSRATAREVALFQPIREYSELERQAIELRRRVDKMMEQVTDAQLLEPWYDSVCRFESRTGEEDRAVCTLCDKPKPFKARRFVIKHIHKKHSEAAEEALSNIRKSLTRLIEGGISDPDLWKRYFDDTWRPLFILHQKREEDFQRQDSHPALGQWGMNRGTAYPRQMGVRAPSMNRGPYAPNMPPQMYMHPRGPVPVPRPQMVGGHARPIGAWPRGMGQAQGRYRDYDAPKAPVSAAQGQFGKPDYGGSLVSYDDI